MDLTKRLWRILRSNMPGPQEDSYADEWVHREGQDGDADGAGAGPGEGSGKKGDCPSQPPDTGLAGYYANLEIPCGSDLATVKRAWRKLMNRYHPDLHHADPAKVATATRLTQELTRAYREIERALKENQTTDPQP